jgi:lauroyl/myristoyl acyltransferase
MRLPLMQFYALGRRLLFRVRPWGLRAPPLALWFLLWPAAGFLTAMEFRSERRFLADLRRLPPSLRTTGFRALFLQRTRQKLASFLNFWADAMALPAWRARARVEGDPRGIEALLRPTKPAVLLAIHVGGADFMVNWLRARGMSLASIGINAESSDPPHRRALNEACDAAGGVLGVPRRFQPAQTKRMISFLKEKGRVLGLTMSTPVEAPVIAQCGDVRMPLAPGGLRLAALAGATAVPALLSIGPLARLTMHVGAPIDPSRSGDPAQAQALCDELLAFYLTVMRPAPGQIFDHLVQRIVLESEAQAVEGLA